jgi:uncharacterized Zn finger protein
MWRDWKPYVPMAARRRNAEREMEKLKNEGYPVSPVVIAGSAIAQTFWGKAWCDNLESYSDYSNRLPRGRSYVRNGAVVDLRIEPGKVKALVSGSDIYEVDVDVSAVPDDRWSAMCTDCAGGIDSLVELLQGRFSNGVMERICKQQTGLFPSPAEIKFSCSCPDWASMCKHVSAVLYGVGARLDEKPELLFKLREVDEKDLIAKAGKGLPLSNKGPAADKVLVQDGLSELFGLELDASEERPAPKPATARGARKPATRSIAKPKRAVKKASARRRSASKRTVQKTVPARPRPTPKRAMNKKPARPRVTAKNTVKNAAIKRSAKTPKPVSRTKPAVKAKGKVAASKKVPPAPPAKKKKR